MSENNKINKFHNMLSRRRFMQSPSFYAATTLLGASEEVLAAQNANLPTKSQGLGMMPGEEQAHLRTWMAFGASQEIWGRKHLAQVQSALASIALAIARFEPVSMLVRPDDMAIAKQLMGDSVTLLACPLDDIWLRDTGPVFVMSDNTGKAAINFNFNGWGRKQAYARDAKVAPFVARQADVPLQKAAIVLEGGAIEVDGQGTAIITESCVLNANRNPGMTKAQCEHILKPLLGLEKIIWLPGIKGKDITDGHTDFYARFARPGLVLAAYDADAQSFDHAVTLRHLEILRTATDASGRKLEIVVLTAPANIRPKFAHHDFAAGYVNFYLCNGAVIAPEFGDAKADAAAKSALQDVFPERELVMLNIDAIAGGGGGIHCTTQQEPKI